MGEKCIEVHFGTSETDFELAQSMLRAGRDSAESASWRILEIVTRENFNPPSAVPKLTSLQTSLQEKVSLRKFTELPHPYPRN